MSRSHVVNPIHINPKELCDSSPGDERATFKMSRHFINSSNETIYVQHRNNLVVPIKNVIDSKYDRGDFIVRTCWTFSGSWMISEVRDSIANTIERMGIQGLELKIFQDRLIDSMNRSFSSAVTVIMDRMIPARLIKENRSVYLSDEDIVLATKGTAYNRPHPYCSEGITDPGHYDFVSSNNLNGFFLEVVDNEHHCGSRFIYCGKRLMEIKSTVDPLRRSGVYYHHAIQHPVSGTELEQDFCELEEAEEVVGLYKTRDEAISGGNPEIVSKIELENAKREAVRILAELEKEKASLEREKNKTAQLKEEYERLKIERSDSFEEKNLQRKDYYEHRSYERKDSSEVIKVAIAVVVGGLSVFGLMRK